MSYAIIGFGKMGQALAHAFARKNMNVTVTSRRSPEELAPQARAMGTTVVAKSLQDALEADTIFLAVLARSNRGTIQPRGQSTGLITERYQDKITGVLSCYDRVTIQGTLPIRSHAAGMIQYLTARGIRIFDFAQFAKPLTDAIKSNAEALAAQHGLEVHYIRKKNFRKEERIQEILRQRGSEPGLVWIFSALEPISDFQKAQQLADGWNAGRLHRKLDEFARRYCPVLEAIQETYHWSLQTVEYATDIVFRQQADLQRIYGHLIRTAIHAVKADDIATFLGKKLMAIARTRWAIATTCAWKARVYDIPWA